MAGLAESSTAEKATHLSLCSNVIMNGFVDSMSEFRFKSYILYLIYQISQGLTQRQITDLQ